MSDADSIGAPEWSFEDATCSSQKRRMTGMSHRWQLNEPPSTRHTRRCIQCCSIGNWCLRGRTIRTTWRYATGAILGR
jgi:hypothetical protein